VAEFKAEAKGKVSDYARTSSEFELEESSLIFLPDGSIKQNGLPAIYTFDAKTNQLIEIKLTVGLLSVDKTERDLQQAYGKPTIASSIDNRTVVGTITSHILFWNISQRGKICVAESVDADEDGDVGRRALVFMTDLNHSTICSESKPEPEPNSFK
jgi:hypothetical protein